MPQAALDYAFLFAAQPLPALALDRDGTVLAASAALCQLTGTSEAELIGRPLTELPALSSLGAAWLAGAQAARRALPDPAPAAQPVFFPLPETYQASHLPWWQPQCRVAPDGSCVLCTAQPVLAEAASSPLVSPLAPRLAQLQFLLDQLPGSLAAFFGPHHIPAYLSPVFEQLTAGQVRTDMPVADTLRGTHLLTPDLLPQLDAVYQHGQPRLLPAAPVYLPGASAATPHYFDLYLAPLPESADRAAGVLLFATDVTEREQDRQRAAELDAEMHRQDQQVRAMTESLPLITFIHDAAGRASYLSPQWHQYTGQSEAEARGNGWLQVLAPEDAQELAAALSAAEPGQAWQREFRLRRHDGQPRWHRASFVPIRDAAGQLRYWYGSATDVHLARQLDEQLRDTDRQLQEILSEVPACIATLLGPELRYGFVNAPMQALLGGQVAPGQSAADYLRPHAHDLLTVMHEVYASGRTFVAKAYRLLLPAADGTVPVRYFDVTLRALPDAQELVRGLLVFAVDVTLQEEARQRATELAVETRRQDARLRVLTETVPQITYTLGLEGTVQYVSPQWYHFTGQPPNADVAQMWPVLIHPDDRLRVQAQQEAARASGSGWNYEYRLRRYDGQYRWMLSRAVPELELPGRALCWHGALTDVHDQRELADTLRRGEAELRFLAESIPQLIWTATADGFIDYYNQWAADYTGLSVAELGPTGWIALLEPSEQPAAARRWVHCVRTGHSYDGTFRLRRHDGQYRWHLIRARRHSDARGPRWFGSCTDVDDQLRLQQVLQGQYDELARTNRNLDNFVYAASHDLHQPLNNLIGLFGELRRSVTFHDPEQDLMLGMVDEALQQLASTLRDLAATVQEQREADTRGPVSLQSIADEVVLGLQGQIEASRATVQLDFTAAPELAYGRANLRSVLHNLLSNALKYAHPGRPPRVSIVSRLSATGQPLLQVRDNGLGMDLHSGPHSVFQLFERQHVHVAGAGVGLYLVQRIVRSHGGRIEVASTVGEGSTFTIHWFADIGVVAEPAAAG
jgi:PAS domain S-box-containing protein